MSGAARRSLVSRSLQGLHRAYRRARPALRAQLSAFDEGMRFRGESERWPEAQRNEWVLRRLRVVVRDAARHVPYYRDLFAREGFDADDDFSFADFARLPTLGRDEIREAGRSLCSEAVDPAMLREDSTGGSTGTPTRLYKGPLERGWGESAVEYCMRRIGVPSGSKVGLLWGHHLDPTARSTLRDRVQDAMQNVRWYESLRLSPEVLERYHAELESWRPACVVAYASALAALADAVADRAGRPAYPTRCFVTGAEKLYAHQRELVERVFQRPVHERYGGRDVGVIGIQLDPRQSLAYWVDWSNVLVEPEVEAVGGEPVGLLITKLHADGMPMLRYRVGDDARFPAGSRPGHPTHSLDEIVGREADRVSLPSGGWVNGLEFPHMLKDFPLRDYHVHQRADASVAVRLVPMEGFGTEERSRLEGLLRANLPGLPVTVELVDAIPRTRANKWRPVVSEVAASSGARSPDLGHAGVGAARGATA